MKKQIMTFLRDEEGLTIVEYAVAAGLISAAAILAFNALGLTVSNIIAALNNCLKTGGVTCTP